MSTSTPSTATISPVATWAIDPAHSVVELAVKHMMFSTVKGHFTNVAGQIVFAEAHLAASSVTAEIEATSIDTGESRRDAHLRSADFLDVERFPTMTFKSTKVERSGDTGLRLEGELTVREVTKPVTLEAEFDGLTGDPWGGMRVAFTATTEIEREDWGMTWNVALEKGGVLVSKKVQIEIDVQAKYVADAKSEAA